MFEYEQEAKANGYHIIAGVDEAGRGPLAGPVVAAAVILKNFDLIFELRDSKQMLPIQRNDLKFLYYLLKYNSHLSSDN